MSSPLHRPTERVAAVVRMLEAGRTPLEIAAEVGIGIRAVGNIRTRYHVVVERTHVKPAPAPKLDPRRCLSCRQMFTPRLSGHFVCATCKDGEGWSGSQPTVHAVVGF